MTTTTQAEAAHTNLLTGVEIWSPVDSTMVRQAAAPSIGKLDELIGPAHNRIIAGRVDETCLSKTPCLVKLGESDLSAFVWPVIDRGEVTAVVAMYLNSSSRNALAAEIWAGKAGRSELCLVESLYSGLDRFAKLSQYIAFPKGSGLPGRVWQTNLPQMDGSLTDSPSFMRSSGAESEGLDVGYALPCVDGSSLNAVALLLSGRGCPAAQVFETWVPDQRGGSLRLRCAEGVYLDAPHTEKASRGLDVPAGDTWIGRAWATRKPEVVCDSTGSSIGRTGSQDDQLTSGIAIPIIVLDDVAAVAVLMW